MSDVDKVASVKYHFLVAIQSTIDICLHLISRNKLEAPADYAEAFRIVGREADFDPAYTANLEKAARFRNRLIHLYWEVDNEELYRILTNNLQDLDNFAYSLGLARE